MPGTQGFGPNVVDFFGFKLSQTVTVTWFIMAVIMVFVLWATRKKEDEPTGVWNFIEMLVDGIYGLVKQTMGEHRLSYAPYMGTLLIFLGIANISGLFGLRPPKADVNTSMAVAIRTFVMGHVLGTISKKGAYVKGFLEPFPALLPLNIIGELATPVSLGFRLFGNIVGGTIIMSLLYSALGFFALVPVPAVLHIYFDLFAGLLQSFIFTMLTMVFVSMAID
jgi:F-type H+-transporting ATPase subunit a